MQPTPDALEEQLDEAVAAYLEAVERGSAPSREEWLARYPDLAEGLATYFADTDRVRCWTVPFCEAARGAAAAAPAVTRFGDYELVREIGRGGKGVVYEARQISLHRTVALKMVRLDQHDEEIEKKRLRHEAETVALLDHPLILPVYEVGEQDGQLYFSMKLITGGSLAERLAEFSDQPRRAALTVVQVARAVHHAHQRGVLHRDLKPSNILLDADGRPYVADFGLARQLHGDSGLTQTGALVGTPSYMAPEQTVADRGATTVAADVYGIGGTIYALLTGGPPFTTASLYETVTQVRERAPEPPSRRRPTVGRDLETICLKCLAKAPEQRYASAEALAEDLERWLAGKPIHARRAGAVERLLKWARRRPGLAALATACVLLLVGLLAGAGVYEWRLREALRETAAQKERASANYREARAALRQILGHAASRSSNDVPRLRELQRAQEEDALAFFLKIAEQHSDDPEVRLDAALARFEVGLLQAKLGDRKAALPNLHAARAALDGLASELPQNGRYRYEHTRVLLTLSISGLSPPAETRAYLEQALQQADVLLGAEPGNPDYLAAKAASHLLLGNLHQQDQPKEAEPHLLQAAALWQAVTAVQPHMRHHRLKLAETWANLSLLRQQRGGNMREPHDRAEEILEQLHREQPDDDQALDSLTGLRINWAYVQLAQGQADAALKDLAKNVQALEAPLRNEPRHVSYRDRLMRSHALRGQILDQKRRFTEAVPERERAVELCPSVAAADFQRLFLALSQVKAGKHAAAAVVLDDWTTRTTPQTPPDQVLHAVGVYCAAVTAVRRDTKLSAAEREAGADRYGKQAVALLQGLAGRGYFRDPKHAATLRSDWELLPLRGRADFARLLAQVQSEAK
jgi:tRNA A-37 threonylcarbamoyl transferase component Bud32/tetratricopeptide (TPR) repeat protein